MTTMTTTTAIKSLCWSLQLLSLLLKSSSGRWRWTKLTKHSLHAPQLSKSNGWKKSLEDVKSRFSFQLFVPHFISAASGHCTLFLHLKTMRTRVCAQVWVHVSLLRVYLCDIIIIIIILHGWKLLAACVKRRELTRVFDFRNRPCTRVMSQRGAGTLLS